MALPDTRHRARYLFGAVVVGHILLISAQVSSRSGPPLLQAALMATLTTAQDAAWTVVGGVRTVWDGYAYLRGVEAENERLSRDIVDLRLRLQQERASAGTTDQLRALVDLRARVPWTTTGAEVVAGSASPDFRSITLNKGRQDGLQPDMPVLAPSGVVGRIVLVAASTASVQLLIDRNAAAAGVIERSRTQGIVLGNGDGTLRIEYLSATAEIQSGDTVVTAGTDRIYPKGLVIGRVERVERNGPTYRSVVIKPVVDFSALETVLVLLAPPPPAPPAMPAKPAEGQAAK
ncbi:MAG: rod shape-determining protein MreC [Acidobacteria bacterium]|nr:rod shape-determining protein MreC [Acidobacteriota bacterium]